MLLIAAVLLLKTTVIHFADNVRRRLLHSSSQGDSQSPVSQSHRPQYVQPSQQPNSHRSRTDAPAKRERGQGSSGVRLVIHRGSLNLFLDLKDGLFCSAFRYFRAGHGRSRKRGQEEKEDSG